MKTYISITGQVNGNSKLKIAISGGIFKKLGNNFYIQFETKKEAEASLKEAFKSLKSEEMDFYNEGGIYLYNDALNYDASCARLHKGNIIND